MSRSWLVGFIIHRLPIWNLFCKRILWTWREKVPLELSDSFFCHKSLVIVWPVLFFRTVTGEPAKVDSSFCLLNLIYTGWKYETCDCRPNLVLNSFRNFFFEWVEILRQLPFISCVWVIWLVCCFILYLHVQQGFSLFSMYTREKERIGKLAP